MSAQVQQLTKQILRVLPGVKDIDAAVEQVGNDLNELSPGLKGSLASELEQARAIVVKQFEAVEILHRHSIIRKRKKWYFGPRPTDFHWPAVESFMLNGKKWPRTDVDSIGQAANEVVSLLENPAQKQFSCRGLVVGHVQSGKTANMTAVIAKALDAGYDTVIVLAGLTNKLRYQTQVRLYQDLVSRNPEKWQVLTPNLENRDFRAPPQGGFLSHSDKAQLAVIKKNVSPMKELKAAIERTLPAVLERLRVLVIDDECDQASVNSAQGELDVTAINYRIRELLSILPAVTYVGYTATPFANVLINPYKVEGQEFDDLYPRDFITALPKAKRYFGTEKLFGKTPSDPEQVQPEEEGLDMVRKVPEEDEALLQPESRQERESFQPAMTESITRALLYFLACCAARRARGDTNQHMTMLVHTSAYVTAHERVALLLQGWVDVNRKELIQNTSQQGQRLQEIWLEEQDRLPPGITDARPIPVSEIFDHLPAVLDALEFPVENGASSDRIDYQGAPRTYVVVGGSILARGLTLEGLMVSYFLRTANQYDTLLQMGRWFGYRPGYEDLPRIWMPEELKLRFRALSAVEQEIRDDIDQYALQELTPMSIAVRIRSIPGMAITAAAKMRSAHRCSVSYWGAHHQTFRFDHLDEALLRRNWKAATELLNLADALALRSASAFEKGRKLWCGVPRSSIQRFFETYSIQSTHTELQRNLLLPFISGDDSRLEKWNVGVVEVTNGGLSEDPLGAAGHVKTVTRAKLNDASNVADIKALMSKRDVLFDCFEEQPQDEGWDGFKKRRLEEVGQVPLLLLYAIDRVSKPKQENNVRISLHAAYDVVGVGIVFPGSSSEGGRHVSVALSGLSADEIDEIAAEEAAQVEAAGVR